MGCVCVWVSMHVQAGTSDEADRRTPPCHAMPIPLIDGTYHPLSPPTHHPPSTITHRPTHPLINHTLPIIARAGLPRAARLLLGRPRPALGRHARHGAYMYGCMCACVGARVYIYIYIVCVYILYVCVFVRACMLTDIRKGDARGSFVYTYTHMFARVESSLLLSYVVWPVSTTTVPNPPTQVPSDERELRARLQEAALGVRALNC